VCCLLGETGPTSERGEERGKHGEGGVSVRIEGKKKERRCRKLREFEE